MIYCASKVILVDPNVPDKFLLVYRNGGYEAAGGRIEVDFNNQIAEDFETCAKREIKEEVGLDVELTNYVGSYSFFWTRKDNCCSCCVVFLGIIKGGTISTENLGESEKGLEPKWVNVDDILNERIDIRDTHAGLRPLLLRAVSLRKEEAFI